MSVTVNLPPEAETRLREQAVKSGQTVEELLCRLTQGWLETNKAIPVLEQKSLAQRVAEWRSWAASHKVLPSIADDSRESIYAGRGE